MKHRELKAKAMQKEGVQVEYEELELEFHLLREMLKARQAEGLTQAEIAEKMGAKPLIITEIESSLSSGNGEHSPSLATLKKYAEAVNCHLEINFVHD